jgi:hypothetical protein
MGQGEGGYKSSKVYVYLAIPQACCSLLLVILAASIASDTWNQDMVEFMVDQWSKNVITDIIVIDDQESCPNAYSTLSAKFQGQSDYCLNTSTGYVTLGYCNKDKNKNQYN